MHAWFSVSQRTHVRVFFDSFSSARFVAERYILKQKRTNNKLSVQIGADTTFWPCTPTLRATMHSVTDRWTNRQTDDANSQSYCLAVRSAKIGWHSKLLSKPFLLVPSVLNHLSPIERCNQWDDYKTPTRRRTHLTSCGHSSEAEWRKLGHTRPVVLFILLRNFVTGVGGRCL